MDLILWPLLAWVSPNIRTGFNPCFGGSYIVTIKGDKPMKSPLSFNPCFGGSYIVTCDRKRNKDRQVVSILVLVDLILWRRTHPCGSCSNIKFQSLFWWILYCDITIFMFSPAFVNKFQSLFWWILYCDNGWCPFLCFYSLVSILVLVDLILWQRRLCNRICRVVVSILVLVDLILWLFLL